MEEKKVINTGGKTKYQPIYDVDSDDDYDVDVLLRKELEEQELDYRWVDFKKAKLNGGRSRGGWIIYKRNSEDPRLQGIKALADPDGLVRNGSMVLAVKTRRNAEKQRDKVRAQNKSLSAYNKNMADELNYEARNRIGGRTKVFAGYDSNS